MRVPTYNSATVQESAAPVTQQSGAPAAAFGGQIGQGLMQAADVFQQIQDDADNLREQDATNLLREKKLDLTLNQKDGYANIKGRDVLTPREGGKSLSGDYLDRFRNVAKEIEGTLANERQKTKFRQRTAEAELDFRAGLQRHENVQIAEYARTVTNATVALETDAALKGWNDPATIEKSIAGITDSLRAQFMREGTPADAQKVIIADKISKVHAGVLASALENNNPLYADGYLKKYAGQMDANDILTVRGHITKAVDMQVGATAGAQVFERFAPRLAPSDGARLENIVMGIESNGRRHGADGKLLEGPQTKYGTAKGEMQVLDGTNKDPGFGVKPAKDDSPEERARVGRDYLNAMASRYQGEVPKILAAYNWGPGNVDKAIKEHGANWLEHAPKETRDYVARGTAEYGAGGGAPARPTLAEMKAELRRQPDLASNPTRLKFAEDRVEVEHKAMVDGIKAQEEQALDRAYRGLYANGGNFEALPASVRTAIPGQKLNGVLDFAREIAKNGGTINRPEAWAQILSLPDDELAKLTPAQFYEKFRPVLDDAHLEKGYALLAKAQGTATDKHLEIITTSERVKRAAAGAGLIPATGDKMSDAQAKDFAQFTTIVDQRVREFERNDLGGKRKANSEELQKIVDGVMVDKAFVEEWGSDPQRPVALLSPDQQANAYVRVGGREIRLQQIPLSARASYAGKLRAAGIQPTEQNIAALWAADNPGK